MKSLIITCLLMVGFGLGGFSQEKSKREIKGDKFFFTYDFDNAIGQYRRSKELTVPGQRNLAVSYKNTRQKDKSEAVYSKLINSSNGVLSEDYYNYAMVLKSNEKYEESNKWMDKFASENPNDLRAKSYVGYNQYFAGYFTDNPAIKIIPQSVNTNSQDFGTSYYQDKVVYASSNNTPKPIKRKYNWNGEPYLNLYIAEVKDGQLKNPKFFDKDLNAKYHDGPATFSNNGTMMAISRNTIKDQTEDKIVELQIHLMTKKDGKWSDPVPFIYNVLGYNVGQPNLTEDGNTIYFVSDMPGGFGGTDIYSSKKSTNGEWSAPNNLGDGINTEGNEMFPFFDETQQKLTFASDGHFGMGGLDIFYSVLTNSIWSFIENPGSPINSTSDDYAMISNAEANKGYFSSNRINGSGGDDIYAFESTKKEIQKMITGIAKDESGKPIPATLVNLIGEGEEIIETKTADKFGGYTFQVENDKNFELIGNKDGYIEGNTSVNSFGDIANIKADVTLLKNIVIVEEEIVIVETDLVPETDLTLIIKLKPIYFDYDKSNIRADAATELDKVVKVLNKYPNLKLDLAAHTDCRGTESYNESLSERRAKSTVDYIQTKITTPGRIKGKGYGETKLINGCECEGTTTSVCTPEQHQKNRRTEFIVKK
jgi:outer membrane protein OmpA-like peptidoglycan-associated protein/tetratricopeptide (TPR) repeat protein